MLKQRLTSIISWFDTSKYNVDSAEMSIYAVDWFRAIPFFGMHLMCFGVIWVGWSWTAVLVAVALYCIRMFCITAFYHRYFSHRTFKTNRFFQLIFALLGSSATQKGPLWWASHHRKHHRYSDKEGDVHSPHIHNLYWSHIGWITSKINHTTDLRLIKDFAKFPELRFLNRFDIIVPVILATVLLFLGIMLEEVAPELGTNGIQMLIWGFFVSTIVLFHATCTINSLSHIFGRKRYQTADESKNNFYLSLLTFGEGWHNNHHRYPGSTRQGFFWWEIDITFYLLKVMSWLRIIHDLRPVPVKVRESKLMYR